MICAIPLLYYSLSDHHLKSYSIATALKASVLVIYKNTSLNGAFKIPESILRLWLWKRGNCSFLSSLPLVLYWTKYPFNKIKSIDTSISNQNNSSFAKTLAFADTLNSARIDTVILQLQMLLLTLFWIPKDLICINISICRHGYYFVKLLVMHFLLF